MQMKYFALTWQEVILDVETVHSLKVTPQNRRRDDIGDISHLIAALFDGMQYFKSRFKIFLVRLVPLRHARIEVPAVVVEARVRRDQFLDFLLRLRFQLRETDYHVGHLHPGVVNVVLDIDDVTGGAQQAHEGVAQNGVAQMPNMRGFVGIDAGVLDQNLAAHIGRAFARMAQNANNGFDWPAPRPQRRASVGH